MRAVAPDSGTVTFNDQGAVDVLALDGDALTRFRRKCSSSSRTRSGR